MAEPRTQREYRVAWEYARDLAAIRKDEIELLRAELVRHGWTIDCSRCAELIDGRDDALADD